MIIDGDMEYKNIYSVDSVQLENERLRKKIRSLETIILCKEEYISHMRKELDRLTLELKKTDKSEIDALYEQNQIITNLLEIK